MTVSDAAIEPGSANVFADLGLPDADARIVKAEPVARIDAIVRPRRITRAEAGGCPACPGPTPPTASGDFRECSLERLFRLLTTLGRDIGIVIRDPPPAAGCASPPLTPPADCISRRHRRMVGPAPGSRRPGFQGAASRSCESWATHTGPDSRSSSFQNGAPVFSQSIRNWQLSRAALRCADAVMTSTIRSPGSRRP